MIRKSETPATYSLSLSVGNHVGSRRSATSASVLATTSAAVLTALIGCSSGQPPGVDGADSAGQVEAERVAEEMLAAYRSASTYSDAAVYVQQSVLRGEGVQRETPWYQMSVQFARPNRLHMRFQMIPQDGGPADAYEVANDGVVVRSTMPGLPDQVHETESPAEITLVNFMPAEKMQEVLLLDALGDMFPQIAMLLNADDKLVFPNDSHPRLLEAGELRGRMCHRLATKHPAGERVLWIDQEDYRLHRMEVPTEGQEDILNPTGKYLQLSIYIDFEQSSFDPTLDESVFRLPIRAGVSRVSQFVDPAPPPPPEILGRQVSDVQLYAMDGSAVPPVEFRGKTTVLDFWQVSCGPCRAQTPYLEQAAAYFADRADVAFRAVSIDSPATPDTRIDSTWASWGGKMPVLRDKTGDSHSKLDVRMTPTLVVVGPDQRVQHFELGAHNSAEPIIEKVAAVAEGDDLAAQAQAKHLAALEERKKQLDAVALDDSLISVELGRPEIAPQSPPRTLQLSPLWTVDSDVLSRPGNVYVLDEEATSGPSILVLNGGGEVVEFDSDGLERARHELPEHEAQTGGMLRSEMDDQGNRWFAVSGAGWKKSFLFDQLWSPAIEFPSEQHPGVAAVALLAGRHGQMQLCVGFWGGWGVHGVGLDGKRLWADRTLDQVVQLGRGPNAAGHVALWCVSDRGTIAELAADGQLQREVRVGDDPLMFVAVDDLDDDGVEEFCGIALPEFGHYRAVVFTAEGEPIAHYDLPRGEYGTQIERIQPVKLPGGRGAWMVAACDGSLHWLDKSGALIDRYDAGVELTGAALTNSTEGAILLISSSDQLAAWQVTPLPNRLDVPSAGEAE